MMLDWCVPASVSVAGLLRHPVDPRRHLAVPDMCARGQTQLHAVSQGGRSHEKHKVLWTSVSLEVCCSC